MGSRSPHGKGRFQEKGLAHACLTTFCRELCKNGWTDGHAVWVMDSDGLKEACVTWGCTLAPPGEYHWILQVRRRCGLFVKLIWPTQLKRELRTQVLNTSSPHRCDLIITNEHYHFMTSSDRFPIPVRSAVSNLTAWCCQNLSRRANPYHRLSRLLNFTVSVIQVFMVQNSLQCAGVPLSIYSLTSSLCRLLSWFGVIAAVVGLAAGPPSNRTKNVAKVVGATSSEGFLVCPCWWLFSCPREPATAKTVSHAFDG